MSTFERKLRLAFNLDLIDKNVTGNMSLFASGWLNVEFTPDDLATAVQYGWAFCAQLTGSRKTENFLASDIVSVDVDHGLTIEEALAHPLVKEYALFVYTTVRHTPKAHRFRVVFALPRTITKARQMVAITRALTRMLGGDRSAVDATRISFGNRGAEIRRIDREVSDDLLRELILDAGLPENPDLPSSEIVSRRSLVTLDSRQELLLADGRRMMLCEIPPKTRVHCPVRPDANASAFIIHNRHGVPGAYCSSCSKSYWPQSQNVRDECDPDDFVRTAREIVAAAKPVPPDLDPDFLPNYGPTLERPTGCRVNIASGQVAPAELQRGITLIRSDKGTGKTEAMKRLAAPVRTVLLIGHRRTLIRGSCKRLRLECYLDLGKRRVTTRSGRASSTSLEPFMQDDDDGR